MIESLALGNVSVNTDNHFLLLREEGLTGLPSARTASYNLAGAHYGQFLFSFYSARRFALDILVSGDSIEDFRLRRNMLHAAFDAMKGEQIMTINLAGGLTVYLTVATITYDFPLRAGMPTAGEAHIELEAAFPFFTGAPKTSQLTLPITGGVAVPLPEVPASLSMGSGGSVQVINYGNAPAYPTLTFTGPVTNPALRNETTGEELRFLIALDTNEILTVNAREMIITDGYGTNRYATKTGDWWTIAEGFNTLSFRADSTDPSAKAQITFADTYLAI